MSVTNKKTFKPFTEFPSPTLLAEAQQEYAEAGIEPLVGEDGVPEPFPPTKSWKDVLSEYDFSKIDKCAADSAALARAAVSYDELAAHLAENAKTDMEKLRSFFVFIGSKDFSTIDNCTKDNRDGIDQYVESPLHDLKMIYINQDFTYYSTMLQKLCRAANIPCRLESGLAKGNNYRVGVANTIAETKGACLVYVAGSWGIVHQCWGSTFGSAYQDLEWTLVHAGGAHAVEEKDDEIVHHALDDDYFLPDPIAFAYTYLMKNPASQLLARPLTMKEFEQIAYLEDTYFKLGITDLSHPRCTIISTDGNLSISFGLDKLKNKDCTFAHNLYKSTADPNIDRLKGSQVRDFSVKYSTGKKLTVNMKFPWIGKYKLDLDVYQGGNICEYLILVKRPCFDAEPFPSLPKDADELGVTAAVRARGLIPISDGNMGVVSAKVGDARLKFKRESGCTLKLRPNMKGDHIIRQFNGKDNYLNIITKLTKEGTHVLLLHVTTKGFKNTIRYIVTADKRCTEFVDAKRYPPALGPDGQTGSILPYNAGGLRPVSHASPFITAPASGRVSIEMESEEAININADLLGEFCATRPVPPRDQYVCMERADNIYRFHVRLPWPGVNALNLTSGSGRTPLYQYVINTPSPDTQLMPFPVYTPSLPPQFKVLQPLDGILVPGETVQCQIYMPSAKKMLVTQNSGKKTKLSRLGNGRWDGSVIIAHGSSKINICADVTEKNNTVLVSYQVQQPCERNKTNIKVKREVAKFNETLKQKRTEVIGEAKHRQQDKEKRIHESEQDFERNQKKYEAEDEEWEVLAERKKLRAAMKSKIIKDIEDLVISIHERKELRDPLKDDVTKAKAMIEKLNQQLVTDYHIISQATMTAIARYREPARPVHTVLQAALLLLGEDEETTEDWHEVQKILNKTGKNGTYQRLASFDIEQAHPEIAARAQKITRRIKLDDLKKKCVNTAAILEWVRKVLEDMPIEELACAPASAHRQRELLGRLTPPPSPPLSARVQKDIVEVYKADFERSILQGISKPGTTKSPWAIDNNQSRKKNP